MPRSVYRTWNSRAISAVTQAVLGQIDLEDKVVTADALHTVKATAEFIHQAGGEFALPVKENRKALFDALDALPWHQVPIAHTATDRGRGRITTRTIQVLPAPDDLPFPHVSQAYLIERHVTGLDGKPLSDVAALGVTSLTAARADPARLAGLVRGQWAIESLHWSATPSTGKISPRSAPAPGRGPWPRSGTSPSAPSTWPGGTTPPKPPAGPAGTWTGPSPSSDSHHGLENGRAGRANADGLVFRTRGNRVNLVAVTVAVSSAHPVLPPTGRLLVLCERLTRQQAGAVLILAASSCLASGSQTPARLSSSPFIIPNQPMPPAVSAFRRARKPDLPPASAPGA